jgi:GAF domain-containing protein
VLDIQDRRAGAFSPIDISTLQTFAEFLAVALNNIRLYNETISKAERLSLVDQINQAISSTLELEELFGRIVKALSESPVTMGALFIKNV